MKTTMILAPMLMAALMFTACDKSKESKDIAEEKNDAKFQNHTDEKDAQFVVETASAMHSLIALSDVAIEKNSGRAAATARAVKPDVQVLLDEVEAFAEAHVISVPVEATDDATRRARKLLDEKPSEFDTKWVHRMQRENKKLIGDLESYGEKTDDLNLKTWLNSALPAARAVQDKLLEFENNISAN